MTSYTLKDFREKFFPNHKKCDRCGGFYPVEELEKCNECEDELCEHCLRRHLCYKDFLKRENT